MSIIYGGGKTVKYDQGDYTFAIRQFPPFMAMKILGEVQKVVAPIVGGAACGLNADSMDKDNKDVTFLGPLFADALASLADHVDGEKMESMAQLLLDENYIGVAPLHTDKFQQLDESAINEVFSGRIIDMIALMIKVFKVNFLDFSKLSSVPTGVRNTLREITSSFRASAPKTLTK